MNYGKLNMFGQIGLVKRKGRYVIMGLPNSGKNSLIELLINEQLIDSLPYVHPSIDYGTDKSELSLIRY